MDIYDVGGEFIKLGRAEHGILPPAVILGLPKLCLYSLVKQKQLKRFYDIGGGRAAKDGYFLFYPRLSILKKLAAKLFALREYQ